MVEMSTTLSFVGQNNKWNTAEDAAAACEAIKNFKDLRCLKLEANTLGVEAARVMGDALALHPEFERAHWKDLFTGRLKTEIPDALRQLFSGLKRAGAHLKELDLSDNALGPVGVEGMIDFMQSPVCYSLEELRLNNNGLGIKGGTMLAESLMKLVNNAKNNGTPLKLKLFIAGRNRLEKEGAKIYAEFFKAVGTLEHVAMPQNGIFHEGIAALAEAFSVNSNLKHINLNDNTFTPKGAKAMANHLPVMQNLEVINFGDCLIKTAGAKSLAKAIKIHHPKLQELHLDSNEIGIEGGIAIVEAVENKSALTKLMLDCNQFGDEGREAITSLLEDYGRLDALDSLEDDEEPDSEDEEEEEDDEDDDEDYEDEDDEDYEDEDEVEEIEPSDYVSPLKRGQNLLATKCTASEFYDAPSASRLLGLGNTAASVLLTEVEHRSAGDDDTFINGCFDMLMRTASIAATDNTKVCESAQAVCGDLARAAFDRAQQQDLSSIATNALLVHLGLIKCEDKSFKLAWDLRGCLIILAALVCTPAFPKTTKSTLQLFLSKPSPKIDCYNQEKHKLMSALYR